MLAIAVFLLLAGLGSYLLLKRLDKREWMWRPCRAFGLLRGRAVPDEQPHAAEQACGYGVFHL